MLTHRGDDYCTQPCCTRPQRYIDLSQVVGLPAEADLGNHHSLIGFPTCSKPLMMLHVDLLLTDASLPVLNPLQLSCHFGMLPFIWACFALMMYLSRTCTVQSPSVVVSQSHSAGKHHRLDACMFGWETKTKTTSDSVLVSCRLGTNRCLLVLCRSNGVCLLLSRSRGEPGGAEQPGQLPAYLSTKQQCIRQTASRQAAPRGNTGTEQ